MEEKILHSENTAEEERDCADYMEKRRWNKQGGERGEFSQRETDSPQPSSVS